jgi:hypothetical protein
VALDFAEDLAAAHELMKPHLAEGDAGMTLRGIWPRKSARAPSANVKRRARSGARVLAADLRGPRPCDRRGSSRRMALWFGWRARRRPTIMTRIAGDGDRGLAGFGGCPYRGGQSLTLASQVSTGSWPILSTSPPPSPIPMASRISARL